MREDLHLTCSAVVRLECGCGWHVIPANEAIAIELLDLYHAPNRVVGFIQLGLFIIPGHYGFREDVLKDLLIH
jgi:hypothetical protein